MLVGEALHELPDELDLGRPVAAVCSSGQRSAVAASILQRHNASAVIHVVDGGVGTWAREGYEVERPDRAGVAGGGPDRDRISPEPPR